ncbi:MAG: GNAT family protein [Clostridia bacterium]|nr:GNAT family protein [Clostridia bacterium]
MFAVGSKVYVRTLKRSDLVRVVKWKNDPEIGYLVRGIPIQTNLQLENKRFDKARDEGDGTRLLITTKENLPIGLIVLDNIDKNNKKASLGMLIGEKQYWNQGYGTDALVALLDYMFIKLDFNRVSLEVFDYNLRAKRAYEKIGFKEEGLQREGLLQGNVFHDIYLMGITKRDFVEWHNPSLHLPSGHKAHHCRQTKEPGGHEHGR